MDVIDSGHSVLIVYEASQRLDNLINELKSKAREIETKKPNDVLNVDQNVSKYDVVICENFASNDEGKLFTALLKQCKPQGRIIIQQVVINNSKDQFILKLKLSGCTNISEPKNIQLSDDEKKHIQLKLNTTEQVSLIEVICSKPSFELGSSAKLNLKPKVDISSVWKIDDTVDEDVETIDPDNLLDEDDLKKPDVQDLRVCSTTGKRKACKDCSCGLADELMEEAGKKEAKDMPKSSCGNCYLGDAFRCAGCPYRGMPAFKPGEKIRLTSDQLEADT